ncbi:TetR/AcrR family transcriptional regulator [Yinghuangia soli]|uniref:TetR/AcrR family transcriptional regulator n=1 Tax=Yinghuangia soli TaxID=2908204 RepID=A0AA41U126_9ACTN|nr:TetR/AcrR family transcriptional regulator [Yinghuangia soli]MCF2527057.1 TetR/AcrR family transcriptional regulator [Yinghuangia soli]
MPKRVDHEERRRQIADALVRVAAAHGLHAAGMREVAAEAGVSVRLVQYYFESKDRLFFYAYERLGEQLGERIQARIRAAGSRPSVRDILEATLYEGLPTDRASRDLHLVYTAYATLALTDRTLAAQAFTDGPDALENHLVGRLRAAQDAGEVPAGLDPAAEIAGLLAISAGLGTSVLVGQRSAEAAGRVVTYHLDRIFGPKEGR